LPYYIHDIPIFNEIPYLVIDIVSLMLSLLLGYFILFGRTVAWSLRILKISYPGFAKCAGISVLSIGMIATACVPVLTFSFMIAIPIAGVGLEPSFISITFTLVSNFLMQVAIFSVATKIILKLKWSLTVKTALLTVIISLPFEVMFFYFISNIGFVRLMTSPY